MKTEPQPAFLGGPDRRWYLISEIEKTAKQVEIVRREMEMLKEEEKREKEEKKERAKREVAEAKEVAKQEMEEKKEKAKKEKEGKAAGAAASAEGKRKRGSEVEQRGVEENSEDEETEEAVKPVKRGRGRPPKEKSAVNAAAKTKTKKSVAGMNADGTAKRGRGRPPKAKADEK